MTQETQSDSEIFRAAARLDPEQRPAFLEVACGENHSLRNEVESLLRAHEPDGSFLQSPAYAVTIPQPIIEQVGSMIGPYKLREQIGEGGFGVVYVAEQEHPVRRKVALKVIKPGMDTKDVIARFEAERQALALMDHPHVARVLDAGATDSGRPYFVMELVQGVTITEFCDRNRLPARDRVALFGDVCRAVHHAHQKGIIHRDLKPSNIMVTLHDGKPVVKVIDFGVAKALSQHLTEKSIYTAYGQMIGTPSYMSPEQAEMSGLGIDTRSDIYALGVLLYELLTGQTPLDANRLRASAYAEIMRIIREEEPARPSMKISTLGEKATIIAQQRHTNPEQLRRDLSGELDWIVMKCLEKDRARRYETANGLARDIERFLHDEPVEACPPSPWYRLQKLARRHRGLLTTVVSFVALLFVASFVSIGLAAWAFRAERQARESLASERIARQEAVEARERADQAARRLRSATQFATEGIEFSRRRNWSAAHERLTSAAKIEPDLNTSYIHRAALYVTLGLWDRAGADYAHRFRLAREADAETCYEHALLRLYTGDEVGYRRACEELVRQHGHSADIGDQFAVLRSCLLRPEPVGDPANLVRQAEALAASAEAPWLVGLAGRAHLKAGDFEKSEARCREAIKLGTRSPGGVHRMIFVNLALALFRQGRQTEAEEALSRAEEARDQWLTRMLTGYVGQMPGISWWDWLEFNISYREAKTLITGSAPPKDPRVSELRERGLAAIAYGDVFTFMDAGREQAKRRAWDSAAASFVNVLDQLPAGFRPSSQEMRFCVEMVQEPEVFASLDKLRPGDRRLWYARGRVFAGRRQWADAVMCYSKTLQLLMANDVSEGTSEAELELVRSATKFELAALHLLAGDQASYLTLCKKIVEERNQHYEPFPAICLSRACCLRPNGVTDWSIPLDLARQAVQVQPRVAWHQFTLGLALYRSGQEDEAVAALKRSLTLRPDWLGRSQNQLVLAMICHRQNLVDEARQWMGKAMSARNELERTMASTQFGYATSEYLHDWLCTQLLLVEAEAILNGKETP